jgi:hypothetical protein
LLGRASGWRLLGGGSAPGGGGSGSYSSQALAYDGGATGAPGTPRGAPGDRRLGQEGGPPIKGLGTRAWRGLAVLGGDGSGGGAWATSVRGTEACRARAPGQPMVAGLGKAAPGTAPTAGHAPRAPLSTRSFPRTLPLPMPSQVGLSRVVHGLLPAARRLASSAGPEHLVAGSDAALASAHGVWPGFSSALQVPSLRPLGPVTAGHKNWSVRSFFGFQAFASVRPEPPAGAGEAFATGGSW